jgi:polar amino acid transport system permease protein
MNKTRIRDRSLLPFLSPWHGLVLLLTIILSLGIAEAQTGAQEGPNAFETLLTWTPFILRGFLMNLAMSFVSMFLGTFFGVLLGLALVSTSGLVRMFARFLMRIFRNTPGLVLLFAVILLVPYQISIFGYNVVIPPWVKAAVAFSFQVLANIAEIVRGAIISIPEGQWESAESLAFTRRQILWMIILPQCVKRVLPSWMNWYAIMAVSTPIASIVGVPDAVGNARQAMAAAGARQEFLIPFYGMILLLFFVYIYPIARWTSWLERKYAVKI